MLHFDLRQYILMYFHKFSVYNLIIYMFLSFNILWYDVNIYKTCKNIIISMKLKKLELVYSIIYLYQIYVLQYAINIYNLDIKRLLNKFSFHNSL